MKKAIRKIARELTELYAEYYGKIDPKKERKNKCVK